MRIPFGQTAAALLMVMGVGGKALAAPAAPADPAAPIIITTPTSVTQEILALPASQMCSRVALAGYFQGPDGDTESWSITRKKVGINEVVITRTQDGLQIIVDWKTSTSDLNPFTVVLPLAGDYTTRTVVTPADADKQVPAIVNGLDPVPMAPIVQNVLSQLGLVKEYMNSCIDITARAGVSSVFEAPHQQVVTPNRVTIPPSLFPGMG